ncbi:hypothetical protein [Polaribacter glomeratus]|uniref:Outer membrane protein beta-barrel domain-containing protein n=1 Tax=Polaribacter glomeratus TaxID=102 RepID=A0A2S7WYK2_9FLAO|nr:hypothetical protein [Polaribacter glomeratus]PQJ82596.1 hypothetical protein BTO16_08410 [Polaribacter glomeratus]TXD64948.1 hypothetical protein ESX12_12455 [Polaribacter glomeratus]
MKKIILTLAFIIAVFSVNAQDISENAIGLRIGGGNGAGGEISYQKALGNNNRLEVDLGLGNDFSDFKATGLYQWVWDLEERFNWYAGFGAGLVSDVDLAIFAAGVIGIEYNFSAPILLSLDYRPEIVIGGGSNNINSNFGLGVRYQF